MDVNGVSFSVEVLKNCICVFLGSRGQTLFNYTISVAGNYTKNYIRTFVIYISFLTEWWDERQYKTIIKFSAKEWYFLDPDTSKVEHLEETNWFKRRHFLVEKCKDASVVGILICKLAGDQTKDIISRMKELCQANGKKSYIVSVGKPNVAKLANFPEVSCAFG